MASLLAIESHADGLILPVRASPVPGGTKSVACGGGAEGLRHRVAGKRQGKQGPGRVAGQIAGVEEVADQVALGRDLAPQAVPPPRRHPRRTAGAAGVGVLKAGLKYLPSPVRREREFRGSSCGRRSFTRAGGEGGLPRRLALVERDARLSTNPSGHRLQVFRDIPVGDAKYAIALSPQPSISPHVSLGLLVVARSVGSTIRFSSRQQKSTI